MACLYIANQSIEFLWDVIFPGVKMYLPAVTSREILVGGISKYLWESALLTADFGLAWSVTTVTFIILSLFGCRVTILPMYKLFNALFGSKPNYKVIYSLPIIYYLIILTLLSIVPLRTAFAIRGEYLSILNI